MSNEWKPFPKVKPPKENKFYLVTFRTIHGELDVCTDEWHEGEEVRDYEWNVVLPKGWRFHENVTAWAEMPSAYTGKEK